MDEQQLASAYQLPILICNKQIKSESKIICQSICPIHNGKQELLSPALAFSNTYGFSRDPHLIKAFLCNKRKYGQTHPATHPRPSQKERVIITFYVSSMKLKFQNILTLFFFYAGWYQVLKETFEY